MREKKYGSHRMETARKRERKRETLNADSMTSQSLLSDAE
jgi:hypothetical protein